MPLTEIIFDNDINMDISIYIGKSKEENWTLIDNAKPSDYWFHLQDYPSPHVIICLPDDIKKVSTKTIKYACVLCKQYSKYKSDKNVKVIYTEIRNVKKTNIVGSVITKNTKVISI